MLGHVMSSLRVKGQSLRRMHEEDDDRHLILFASSPLNLLHSVEIVVEAKQPESVSADLEF